MFAALRSIIVSERKLSTIPMLITAACQGTPARLLHTRGSTRAGPAYHKHDLLRLLIEGDAVPKSCISFPVIEGPDLQ
jgi:hypothetical protein